MYPEYSTYALDNFKDKTIPEQTYFEQHGFIKLFNNAIGSIAYYASNVFSGYYSPAKITEGVVSPSKVLEEPNYLIQDEEFPEEVLKTAMGVDFLYKASPSAWARKKDSHVQYLKFLNASRYVPGGFGIAYMIKGYRRNVSYKTDGSGDINFDSGLIEFIPDTSDPLLEKSEYTYSTNTGSNGIFLWTESWRYFDIKIEFSRGFTAEEKTAFVNKFYMYYKEDLKETKRGIPNIITETTHYDDSFNEFADDGTIQLKASEPTVKLDARYDVISHKVTYRYATEFKSKTIQQLATLYKVPV